MKVAVGSWLERSPAVLTALTPLIRYDAGAAIAYEAVASGKTGPAVAQVKTAVIPQQLEKALGPSSMTTVSREKQE